MSYVDVRRDSEAKAAAERAHKFKRDVIDLRRKLRGNGSSNKPRGEEKGAGAAGEGRDHLRGEVSRLKVELEEEREACSRARAEGDKLQAALEVGIVYF